MEDAASLEQDQKRQKLQEESEVMEQVAGLSPELQTLFKALDQRMAGEIVQVKKDVKTVQSDVTKLNEKCAALDNRMTALENSSANGAAAGAAGGTGSSGVWEPKLVDIKVCNFDVKDQQGITIDQAKEWTNLIKQKLEQHLAAALGAPRARVQDSIYKFSIEVNPPNVLPQLRKAMTDAITAHPVELKLGQATPKVNIENSPERIKRWSCLGSMSEAIEVKAASAGYTVQTDWNKTLTIKVSKNGEQIMVAGVSMQGTPVWMTDGLRKVGWRSEEVEVYMRK